MKEIKEKRKNWEKEFESKFNIAYIHNKGWAFLKEEIKSFIRQLLKSEKERWEKEKIMAIDSKILKEIRKERGSDEFQETIIEPIEKRITEKLLERIELEERKILENIIENEDQNLMNYGYNQAIADLEKLKEEIRNEN